MKQKKDIKNSWWKHLALVIKEVTNYSMLTFLIIIAWWYVTTHANVSKLLIPSIGSIGDTFLTYLKNGTIFKDFLSSFRIVLIGYGIGSLLGVTLGVLMGIFVPVNKFFTIILNALRQVPPLAWIPLFILWFGIGDLSKICMICMGTFYATVLNSIQGIKSIPKGYLEFAKLYKIKKKDLFFKIYLKGALPSIFVGLRLGASDAWMGIVGAEMIASSIGMGYRLNSGRNLMQTNVVILYIILIGVVGCLMDLFLRFIEKRITSWRQE